VVARTQETWGSPVKYRTIVADPPWDYPEGFAGGHSRTPGKWSSPVVTAPLPYPSLSVLEIGALPVREMADDDARLFLWTTNRYLPDSFYVLANWGFKYRQTLVWHKTDVNLPAHIAPNSAEYILVGARGNPDRLGTLTSAVFTTARGKRHSAKPDAFLDMVESVSRGPYLELFARRQRLGWDTWGDEALAHVEIAS
jgi:N6-adenosine-specific RNA methylase IME4